METFHGQLLRNQFSAAIRFNYIGPWAVNRCAMAVSERFDFKNTSPYHRGRGLYIGAALVVVDHR